MLGIGGLFLAVISALVQWHRQRNGGSAAGYGRTHPGGYETTHPAGRSLLGGDGCSIEEQFPRIPVGTFILR